MQTNTSSENMKRNMNPCVDLSVGGDDISTTAHVPSEQNNRVHQREIINLDEKTTTTRTTSGNHRRNNDPPFYSGCFNLDVLISNINTNMSAPDSEITTNFPPVEIDAHPESIDRKTDMRVDGIFPTPPNFNLERELSTTAPELKEEEDGPPSLLLPAPGVALITPEDEIFRNHEQPVIGESTGGMLPDLTGGRSPDVGNSNLVANGLRPETHEENGNPMKQSDLNNAYVRRIDMLLLVSMTVCFVGFVFI